VNDHRDGVGRPRETGERDLRAERSCYRASCAVEGDERAVARRVDLPSTACRKAIAQKTTVVATHDGEDVVTNAPNEIRRLFDVAEEEGDCATRQRCAAHQVIFAPWVL
jgi:hypothetical protein